jgi:hypothetical protein
LPTVPQRKSSGVEIVDAVDVSVMPQPSSTSTPAASKNSRISGLIGAAPVTARLRFPPNRPRIFDSTCLSASRYWKARIGFGLLPARSSARTFLPTPIAQSKTRFFRPPSSSTADVAAV